MQKYLVPIVVVVVACAGAGFFLLKGGAPREAKIVGMIAPTEQIKEYGSWGVYLTVEVPEPGTYTLTFEVDGEPYQVEVSFENAGTIEKYVGTPELPTLPRGSHTVRIGGKEATVQFREPRPAEFVITSLTVLPDNVSTNKSVTVKATVKNVGEMEGTFRGTVRVGPVSREIPIFTLGEGMEREVRVTIDNEKLEQILENREEAVETVRLENRTATLYLRKPTPPTASYLSINVPAKAYVGDTLTIGILVKNVGDLEGSVGLEATVGGERISQSMTLKPGEEREWQIPKELTSEGTLEVRAPTLG
ncbi:MAG: hypothetical protein QXR87_06420, partial [Candidatus Hadarchaeales archaeon]